MTDAPRLTTAKADYGSIYVAPDPRSYYATLGEVEYMIPGEAGPLFDRALDVSRVDGAERTLLDIGCSYGINSTVLRTQRTWDDIAAHYAELNADPRADSEAVRDADRALLARHGRAESRVIRGLDASRPAIDYAVDAGLLDDGWAENLEESDPSAAFSDGVSDTGMIICCGAIGYVTDKTYRRVLDCLDAPDQVWLVSAVLRAFSYDPIAEVCAEYGLVSEPVPGPTLRQRRFANEQEEEAALYDVRSRGLDPAGMESDGWYHADAWLTRPAADARARPVETLFSR